MLFFLLLSLLLRRLTVDRVSPLDAATLVSGALLTRLFERASYDETSRKAVVESSADETRTLARAVIAEVKEQWLDRIVTFRGRRLLEEKERRLREAGTDIVFHTPIATVELGVELSLPWSAVFQKINPECQVMASSYFARSTSLRDVFTRQVAAPPRRGASRQRNI